jgi:hypothetical protein
VVPDDDGAELLGVIEWSDIVRARYELDEQDKMKDYLRFI